MMSSSGLRALLLVRSGPSSACDEGKGDGNNNDSDEDDVTLLDAQVESQVEVLSAEEYEKDSDEEAVSVARAEEEYAESVGYDTNEDVLALDAVLVLVPDLCLALLLAGSFLRISQQPKATDRRSAAARALRPWQKARGLRLRRS
mmetsp:Transcript_22808/g.44829  ORF Transcript_22808/g.44829 Transcript_22808/m.44829 type:complete len:145 (+) Transcript_22808:2564-2998(+)